MVASIGTLHGADILDTPVPWSGRITGYTVADLVVRMRGWSDVGDGGRFILSAKIPEKLATKELEPVRIPEKPRPTYGELLVSALENVGQKSEVRRGKQGIEIVYLYVRSFKLSARTRQVLNRKRRLSLEGIQSELDDKGWSFSESATMFFSAEQSRLVIKGTSDDLESMAKFLGQK